MAKAPVHKQLPYLSVCAPYVFKDIAQDNYPLELSPTMKMDATSFRLIKELVTAWCIQEGFLVKSPLGELVPPLASGSETTQMLVYMKNFRSLISQDELNRFVEYVENENMLLLLTKVHELVTDLCVEVGIPQINAYINTLYRSYDSMTRILGNRDSVLSWEAIHETYPYLWVLILVQSVMRTYA